MASTFENDTNQGAERTKKEKNRKTKVNYTVKWKRYPLSQNTQETRLLGSLGLQEVYIFVAATVCQPASPHLFARCVAKNCTPVFPHVTLALRERFSYSTNHSLPPPTHQQPTKACHQAAERAAARTDYSDAHAQACDAAVGGRAGLWVSSRAVGRASLR